MSQHNPLNPHPLLQDYIRSETRRQFFKRGASLMGTAALAMRFRADVILKQRMRIKFVVLAHKFICSKLHQG